jgi:hypothetical protein
MRVLALIAAAALAGCGEDPPEPSCTPVPSEMGGDCWPDIATFPRGTATLGTGRAAFEAVPDELPLEYGPQGGFDLVAHVRMTGFYPGNPDNLLDPANPRTRIRAFFADTNIPLDFNARCGGRTAYVPSAAGGYEYPAGVGVVFETCWRSDRLIGKRIRIELEIMDDCGGYATDTKTVTAAAPTNGMYPIEQDTPGCMHAVDP